MKECFILFVEISVSAQEDQMSEKSLITIRNGAIASTIAGIFLLAIPALRRYFITFFSWLWSGAVWCWDAIFSYYVLPGWSLLIIFILAAIGLVKLLIFFKGKGEKSDHISYVEDYVFNVKWRWRWVNEQIIDLWCFCPSCDATLVYNDRSSRNLYNPVNKTDFLCENCNHRIITTINGGAMNYAISAVEREIDRRIRTGEYKNIMH